jgi:outer membrane protein OmpA-like peptidoglycan-associated protein
MVSMRCLFFFSLLFKYSLAFGQGQLTHTVQFELDRSDITSEQKELLEIWMLSIDDTASRIEVIGYTDYLGSNKCNMALSENRANAVITHVKQAEQLVYRASLVSAVGENFSQDEGRTEGKPTDRKVEIIATLKLKSAPTPSLPAKESEKQIVSTESDLLVQAEVGQTVILGNLNFFPGRHYLVPSAMPELERLIGIMKENPTMEIEVQGHICCKLDSIDGFDVNTRTYDLSANRAEYITEQLVLAGIGDSRIKHRGFAGSRPLINPEITDRDRQRNRRVEIKILKK